jgi:hypothetical protein
MYAKLLEGINGIVKHFHVHFISLFQFLELITGYIGKILRSQFFCSTWIGLEMFVLKTGRVLINTRLLHDKFFVSFGRF